MRFPQTLLVLAFGLMAPSSAIPHSAGPVVPLYLHPASKDSDSSPLTQSAPVLLPAVRWDHPIDDPSNLLPTNSSNLYFSNNATSDPSVQHLFASASATFQYSSVVLEHSSSVASVSCGHLSVLVSFNSHESRAFASNSWTTTEELVLVTSSNSCGASTNELAFLLIESIQQVNGTLSVLATVREELNVEDAFDQVSLIWGMYYPPNTNGNTPFPSSGVTKRTQSHHSHRGRGVSHHHHALNKRFSVLGSGSKSVSADVSAVPENIDQSPWGPATSIFSSDSVELYCVDCAFHAHVDVQGSANLNHRHPTQSSVQISVNASLDASLGLGLVGKAEFHDTKSTNIVTEPIPDLGFTILSIFDIGVFVVVDASATIGIEAEGEALLGVDMIIPDFQAVIAHDLSDVSGSSADGSQVQGFSPIFKPTFNASGSLTASAQLSLPVSLQFGVKVGSFNATVALVEAPSLFGNVTFAGNTPDAPTASDGCNDGFEYLVDLQNDVNLNLFNSQPINLDHRESPPLLQGCFLPDGISNSTSTSASAPTLTSSSTTVSTDVPPDITSTDTPTITSAPFTNLTTSTIIISSPDVNSTATATQSTDLISSLLGALTSITPAPTTT